MFLYAEKQLTMHHGQPTPPPPQQAYASSTFSIIMITIMGTRIVDVYDQLFTVSFYPEKSTIVRSSAMTIVAVADSLPD